jgi:hypothetical protein
MTREKLIFEILALWVEDEEAAYAIDELSYTHASCGYEDAQSYVEDLLTMTVEDLQKILDKATETP